MLAILESYAGWLYLPLTVFVVWKVWKVSGLSRFAARGVIQWYLVMVMIQIMYGADWIYFLYGVLIASFSFTFTWATYVADLKLPVFGYLAACGGFVFLAANASLYWQWDQLPTLRIFNAGYLALLWCVWHYCSIPVEIKTNGRL